MTLPMDGFSATETDTQRSQQLLRDINAEERRSGKRPTHIVAPAAWLPGYAEWYSWPVVREEVGGPIAIYDQPAPGPQVEVGQILDDSDPESVLPPIPEMTRNEAIRELGDPDWRTR